MNHYTFSEMIVGKKASMEVQVGEKEIAAFAELSGDMSSVHVDDAFAKEKGFKRRIAHGALLVSYISRFLGTILPGANGLLQSIAIDFRLPCYPGTKIRIDGEVVKHVESVRIVRLKIAVTDSTMGEILATAQVQSGIREGQAAKLPSCLSH